LWEIVGIDIAEIVEHGLAMCVHPLTVVVQFPADTGKIEFQHQIGVAVRRGVLSYVEVSEQGVKLIAGAYIIIMLQHAQGQTFAKSPGTDEEEKPVRLFYQWDEGGFVHIIIIVETDVCKVHHTVWQSFPV
jgi:hypothetical protein